MVDVGLTAAAGIGAGTNLAQYFFVFCSICVGQLDKLPIAQHVEVGSNRAKSNYFASIEQPETGDINSRLRRKNGVTRAEPIIQKLGNG